MNKRHSAGPWLSFFRIVNLPTVPGDVVVGAAAVAAFGGMSVAAGAVAFACAASCMLYLFGLADNDIVGAKTDSGRPIPDGEITMAAARTARGVCLASGFAFLAACGVRTFSLFAVALALVCAVIAYNRTKNPALMGLCRGLNVVIGVAAQLEGEIFVVARSPSATCAAGIAFMAWTLYIAAVTKYSDGEDSDPARKRRVGLMIGGIVYLQISALVAFSLLGRPINGLLVAGAALLVLRRMATIVLPKVGSS